MKNSVDKFKSLFNKKNIIIFSILVIVLISSYFLYMKYKPKFKNITIEAGTKSVSIRDFLTNAFYINNAKILTDLSKIDLDKTSEIDIKLSYKGNEEIVKLTIVDTIAPNVESQNITRYSGYEINPNDFILNLDELEDTTPESKDITVNVTEIPIEDNTISNDNIIEVTDKIDLIKNENIEFELPIKGSSGYATIDLNIKEDNTNESNNISVLKKGEAFEILSEDNNWWNIKYKNIVGWVDNTFCMINLPDVIPSIIYEASNSKSSLFKSSGYDLPNITNEKLYDVFIYNDRFNKDTYVMPVLYSMAKKIYQTQQLALKNGDSLKIYETYRPYEVQMKVVNSLKDLLINNIDVNNGINNGVWNEGWFISTSLSNHQLGVAIDTSLVKVNSYKVNSIMDYNYIEIIDYYEYEMLTNMHELSAKSAVFTYGINSTSKTAWIDAPLTSSITDGAIKLQKYCTDSGLTPLASEWWHFNDLDSKELIKNQGSNGKYYINECLSNKNI